MIDFRYHALSLVAVFLALALGIFLGVTIGDSLVSQADRDLRASLRRDVVDARGNARQALTRLERRDRLIGTAFPALANGRLRGRRVAVVASGALPEEIESSTREAVEIAGGRIDSVSTFAVPGQLTAIGNALAGPFVQLTRPRAPVAPLARRIGRAVVTGGRLAGRLRAAFPDSFRGDFAGADAVVFYRSPRRERSVVATAFDDGLVDGLERGGAKVVGAEQSETSPSQVSYYKDRGLSSEDSVDLSGGQLGLVLALDGADGAFGFKDSADAPLPSPLPAKD